MNKVGRPPLNEPLKSIKIYAKTLERLKSKQKQTKPKKSIGAMIEEATNNE